MNEPSRRAFLASAAVAVSGCSALSGDGQTKSTLDRLHVANRDIRAHTVHLYVEYDDHDPMVWRTLDLGPPDGERPSEVTVDYDWPDDPGDYTIRARTDDHRNWEAFTDVASSDCTAFELDVLEGGSLLGTNPTAIACPLDES